MATVHRRGLEGRLLAAKGSEDTIDIKQIDAVLTEVLGAIEHSQEQLLSIADDARAQYQETAMELARLKEEAARQVALVDELEKEDRKARLLLLKVSENIGRHSEDEIRTAYDGAREARVRLQVAREKEALLRRSRDALELRFKRVREMVHRAEDMINNVGMAFHLLTGRLKDITAQVEGLNKRSQLAVSVIKAQEEERRRVARDIHDGPAQHIANLVFRIEVCQKLLGSDVERARGELEQLKGLLRDSLQEVRRIIFDLRPLALDDLGLAPALRGYLENVAGKSGLETELKVLGLERRTPPAVEITLFRLVQEAVNNAWKHARAGRVMVKLEFLPLQVRAVVEDNGHGFDVEAALGGGGEHFGLLGMRERVGLVEGTLEITSQPGRGTRVSFAIPVKE